MALEENPILGLPEKLSIDRKAQRLHRLKARFRLFARGQVQKFVFSVVDLDAIHGPLKTFHRRLIATSLIGKPPAKTLTTTPKRNQRDNGSLKVTMFCMTINTIVVGSPFLCNMKLPLRVKYSTMVDDRGISCSDEG